MSIIVINPYEGYAITNGYSASHEGQDFNTPRIMGYMAASDGVVVQTGGEFNQIIVKMDDGRYWRTAENAQILVSVGQRISIFQVIARNSFFRGGIYRSPHINGGGDNNRSVFTSMVTMTQAQAHAALAPAGNVRHTVPVGANVRPAPSLTAPGGIPLKGNINVTMLGFMHGSSVSGSDVWFQHVAGFSHSSGFTDGGTHDLSDLTPPPVVVPDPPVEPPVVVPPVVVTPPVVVPPVVVEPPVIVPPVVVTPPPRTKAEKGGLLAVIITGIVVVVGAIITAISGVH